METGLGRNLRVGLQTADVQSPAGRAGSPEGTGLEETVGTWGPSGSVETRWTRRECDPGGSLVRRHGTSCAPWVCRGSGDGVVRGDWSCVVGALRACVFGLTCVSEESR